MFCQQETNFKYVNDALRPKGWKKDIPAKTNHKKPGITILIVDRVVFSAKYLSLCPVIYTFS